MCLDVQDKPPMSLSFLLWFDSLRRHSTAKNSSEGIIAPTNMCARETEKLKTNNDSRDESSN